MVAVIAVVDTFFGFVIGRDVEIPDLRLILLPFNPNSSSWDFFDFWFITFEVLFVEC